MIGQRGAGQDPTARTYGRCRPTSENDLALPLPFARNPDAGGGTVGFPGGRAAGHSPDCLGGDTVAGDDDPAGLAIRIQRAAYLPNHVAVRGCRPQSEGPGRGPPAIPPLRSSN